jgi:hypothetical protein
MRFWYLRRFGLAFVPSSSPRLDSNTEKEDIKALGRVKFCGPITSLLLKHENFPLSKGKDNKKFD